VCSVPIRRIPYFVLRNLLSRLRKKINNGGGRLSLSCPIVGRKSSLMSNAFAFVPRRSNFPRAGGVGGGDVEGRECSS
jgi:hypothetical protein